ncbi:hypothetical protein [Paenibacillus sedimenti]|uniref:Uncharacterized protein n=1 Tax=Paenibacillus sedimenti TaxID=2770274 RepID=A0A926QKY8_9BACL|nr:hypothetical protein [Paenibacillus sedimenti]MBD0383321.1 hypothetical protein [Paenibacillus sedimenti]
MQAASFLRSKWIQMILIGVAVVLLSQTAYRFYLLLGPRQAHYTLAPSQSLQHEHFGGITLGQSIKKIKNVLPSPTIMRKQDNDNYHYYNVDNGAIVATKAGSEAIVRIMIAANAGSSRTTTKGIGIDSKADEIKTAYGEPSYRRSEQGATIFGYLDKEAMIALEFWLFDERVTMIRLDLAEMA